MPWTHIITKPCINCFLPVIESHIGDGSRFQCSVCKKEYVVYTKMFSKEQTYKEYTPDSSLDIYW